MKGEFSRRDVLASAAGGAAAMALGGCEMLGLQWRYRYRLAATIVKGRQRLNGFSVVEIIREKGSSVNRR